MKEQQYKVAAATCEPPLSELLYARGRTIVDTLLHTVTSHYVRSTVVSLPKNTDGCAATPLVSVATTMVPTLK